MAATHSVNLEGLVRVEGMPSTDLDAARGILLGVTLGLLTWVMVAALFVLAL